MMSTKRHLIVLLLLLLLLLLLIFCHLGLRHESVVLWRVRDENNPG